jgi:hypothetical protein
MNDKLEMDLEGRGIGLIAVVYWRLLGGTEEQNSVKEEHTK